MPARRSGSKTGLLIALAAIIVVILGASTMGLIPFAMTRVGDAFKAWTGVEIEGKTYPPNAGDGPSWDFWVDPDLNRYGRVSCPYYNWRGHPACSGIADLEIRHLWGDGLYVTDSGFLVQAIKIEAGWHETPGYEKCGHDLCDVPSGERMGDAWIYIQLDSAKLKGGYPIYVEVDPEYVEKWQSYAEAQASKIAEIRYECGGDRDCERQLIYLGHPIAGELTQEVPFAWFPENSTIKFKLTGLTKAIGWTDARTVRYLIYIAPPEGQMFKVVTEKVTLRARTHYGAAYWMCKNAAKEKGWSVLKYYKSGSVGVCIIGVASMKTYYKLVEAETTPQLVTTTLTKVTMSESNVGTQTTATTMTVNRLIEKTVTLEKTITKTVTTTVKSAVTVQESVTMTTTQTLLTTVTETVPVKTTVTVRAPKTTYVIYDAQQAEQVAAAYRPPKPLTAIIWEKLLEFYNWLLSVLGLR